MPILVKSFKILTNIGSKKFYNLARIQNANTWRDLAYTAWALHALHHLT
jgi:hypothetical protein